MGMGYAAASSWTISSENVRKIVPEAWDKLEATLTDENDLDSVAQAIVVGEELPESIYLALEELYKSFEDATRVDKSALSLELNYYSEEDGDRYDDVEEGALWLVNGVVELTPAGKKYNDLIEFSRWTIFG